MDYYDYQDQQNIQGYWDHQLQMQVPYSTNEPQQQCCDAAQPAESTPAAQSPAMLKQKQRPKEQYAVTSLDTLDECQQLHALGAKPSAAYKQGLASSEKRGLLADERVVPENKSFQMLQNLKNDFFITKYEAVQLYLELTKNQLIDDFFVRCYSHFDVLEKASVKFSQNYANVRGSSMLARSFLITLDDTEILNKFLDHLRSQREFENVNGIYLRCLVNLWFYGLRIAHFNLNIPCVTRANVFMAQLRNLKRIGVEYQPQSKCGRKYHIVRLPLYNVSDCKMKLLECEQKMVLLWND